MAIRKPEVDAVVVGMGWTGAIMAKELTEAGLRVVALERGPDRDTEPDFAHPKVLDELSGSVHRKFLQNLSQETVTVRHKPSDVALPYRQMGSSSRAPASAAPARTGRAANSAPCRKIFGCAQTWSSASVATSSRRT